MDWFVIHIDEIERIFYDMMLWNWKKISVTKNYPVYPWLFSTTIKQHKYPYVTLIPMLIPQITSYLCEFLILGLLWYLILKTILLNFIESSTHFL